MDENSRRFELFGRWVAAHHNVEDNLNSLGEILDNFGLSLQMRLNSEFRSDSNREDSEIEKAAERFSSLSAAMSDYGSVVSEILKFYESEKTDE